MKKRLALITLLVLFSSTMFGQYISHWGPVPTNYDNSMTLLAKIKINGEDQQSTDLEVGAFCGEELRGATKLQKVGSDYIIFLNIGSDHAYDIINFKLYNPANENVQYLSDYTVPFITNNMIGSPGNYETLDFVPSYWNKVDIVICENTMTVNATIAIDGVSQSNRGDLEVAAFSGDELRDLQRPIYDEDSDQYVVYFVIQGISSETINFQLYDHSGNILHELLPLDSDYTVHFNDGDIIGQDAPVTINFISQSVAKIGDNYFNTLKAAVEAATAGQTITLLKNAEGSGVVINKSLTIDFNGKTYTFTSPAVGSNGTETQGFQILEDNDVVLKNGTLKVTDGDARTEFAMLIQNYADLTINNMTLNGDNLDRYTIKDYDYSYVLSNNSGEVSIEGETNIIANPGDPTCEKEHRGVAFDACKYANYSAPVVTLGENVTVEGKVELTGGELYANAALSIVAKKSFERVSGEVGATEGWGTISTPIANVEIPSNGNHDIYSYDEKNAMWRFYKEGEGVETHFTEFELGQGYLYANTSDITIELEGLLNTQPVSMQISNTEAMGALAGFNFVGNPFAHNISEAHFATTNGAQLSNGFYVVSPTGAIVVRPEDAIIAPMESVMVQTNAETTLTINNVASESKRSAVNNGRLEITVANANYSDVAYVSFNEGRGLNKIGHRNVEIPMVYVPVDGVNYAIAMMNQDVTEIPVSFQAATMGQYTIGVEAQDCEYAMMTLVDRFTGIETNLLIEDYTFIAKSNDSAERFIIKLAMDNSNGEANENFAFINNGMMYIYNIEGQGTVSVYDVTGRPVAEYNVATSANISTSDFAAGMYIIRMSDENGVKTQKIVIE